MQEQIFEMLVKKDEITWQSLIYELIRSEQMDPWDIDVSVLTYKFIEMLKKMQEMNLLISGKVLLASAILLKIKSTKLVGEDLANLDKMINFSEQEEDEYTPEEEYDEQDPRKAYEAQEHTLVPRTPQPRQRKVSIYELVDALQKALEVRQRRIKRYQTKTEPEIVMPTKKFDVGNAIEEILKKIEVHYEALPKDAEILKFSELAGSDDKETIIYAYLPLLHLTNQKKTDLNQEEVFGDIEIYLQNDDHITFSERAYDEHVAELLKAEKELKKRKKLRLQKKAKKAQKDCGKEQAATKEDERNDEDEKEAVQEDNRNINETEEIEQDPENENTPQDQQDS